MMLMLRMSSCNHALWTVSGFRCGWLCTLHAAACGRRARLRPTGCGPLLQLRLRRWARVCLEAAPTPGHRRGGVLLVVVKVDIVPR
jgi:hypothetical protein